MSTKNLERLRRVLAGRLESLEQAGLRELPKAKMDLRQARNVGAELRPQTSAAEPGLPEADSPTGHVAMQPSPVEIAASGHLDWSRGSSELLFANQETAPREISAAPTLDVLQQEVAACKRCEELACTRKQTVFGVGNPHARLCFIGEAPGADEDAQGEPFVGRAGQLLNKIIEACKMRREDVYICNILKCRPPGNRNPHPIEAANCRRFLERQLELIEPEFICCLGTIAAQNLLGTPQSIGKLRGKVHWYRGAMVVCTYHPAYLLRNPPAKKDTWDDMKLLMREMGAEL
jgi:DNA polymerase